MPPAQTTIRCAQCGQPVPAVVRTVIDVQSDPQGKALLMNGRLNMAQCPACGHTNRLVAPVLYHDADKQLLIVNVPGEVLRGQSEEKVIGDLMNELTRILPKELFKSYMFNPRRSLTLQGLAEQVMQADGITPEMLDMQRKRIDLLQEFINAATPDALETLVKAHDAEIDVNFFQTMRLMAQRLVQDGRPDIAGRLVVVQDLLLAHSTFGQELAAAQQEQEGKVQEVASAIQSLGEDASPDDFLNMAIEYADDEEKLQAMVGLVRPVFDYNFFQMLTQRIDQAPADEREKLEQARDTLLALTQTLDEELQQTVQRTAQFLQVLVNSANPDEMLEANADMVDEDFMAVLTANIQEAERRQDAAMMQRLKAIYDKVVGLLRAQMSPELSFLNDLIGARDEAEQQKLLTENKGKFDETLLKTADAIEDMLRAQGQAVALDRLNKVRPHLANLLKSDD